MPTKLSLRPPRRPRRSGKTPGPKAEGKAKARRKQARRDAADAAFVPLDPEAANHALLVRMQAVEVARRLKPCDLERRAGLKHQHHRKLRPQPANAGKEMHVTFVTVFKWCNGTRLSFARLVHDLLADLQPGCDPGPVAAAR